MLMKVRRIIDVEVPDISDRIAKAIKVDGRGYTVLSRLTGMSSGNLYRIAQGKHDILPEETLRKIEEVLEVDFSVRFE